MAQNIGNKVYISGFMVQIGAECTAQFMRTHLRFQRCDPGSVLFYHQFDRSHADPFLLQGEKERVLMAR